MIKKKKTTVKKAPLTYAIEGKTKDGTHIVGIGDLRVVIVEDGDLWFAQGLEIDYAAEGKSIKDVKHKFEAGLACTIHEHVRIHGNIKGILQAAPPKVWEEIIGFAEKGKHFSFSQVSFHQNIQEVLEPIFSGIMYLEQNAA